MNLSSKDIMVFIATPYPVLNNNELFKATSRWNRDNEFSPFILLQERLSGKGFSTNTADYLLNGTLSGRINIYVSMGITTDYRKLVGRDDVLLQSYYIIEPTTVDPYSYNDIDNLTKQFDGVYVHNTDGVGYERHFHNQPNLRKLFTPQIRESVIDQLWSKKDRDFLAMVNTNKTKTPHLQLSRGQSPVGLRISLHRNPGLRDNELYSERIRALIALQSLGKIDLYGYGWDTSLYQILHSMPSHPLSFPNQYWKHRKALRAIYKGSVKSKYDTLSQYRFTLSIENTVMPGYITREILDCFFVGTVPVYLGAPDIEKYIPKNCFIDMRDFKDYNELYAYLLNLSDEAVNSYREAGREFLSSEQFQPFTKESFVEQFEIDLMQTLKANGINLTSLRNANSAAGMKPR